MTKEKSRVTSIGTVGTFLKVGYCSGTLCNVLNRAFQQPLTLEEKASMSLAGGIMQYGYQCGMIWGAVLAAGAEAHRLFGPGPQAQAGAIKAAQRVVESFQALHNTINCLEITDIDNSSSNMQMFTYFFLKGGTIGCIRMAARYAPVALSQINTALAEPIEAAAPPVSCAALLAQKMGASDIHTAMAAGLAGGIGLSGGACGALGAAIWLGDLNRLQAGEKIEYKGPQGMEMIDKFLKCSDYEFECSEIVGRKFEGVGDHAAHVQAGGCSEIIELLATA